MDTETSVSHELTQRDKKSILGVLRQVLSYEPDIECFLCKACFEHNPDYPYHIQLIDKNVNFDKEMIKHGYYNLSFMKKEEPPVEV